MRVAANFVGELGDACAAKRGYQLRYRHRAVDVGVAVDLLFEAVQLDRRMEIELVEKKLVRVYGKDVERPERLLGEVPEVEGNQHPRRWRERSGPNPDNPTS